MEKKGSSKSANLLHFGFRRGALGLCQNDLLSKPESNRKISLKIYGKEGKFKKCEFLKIYEFVFRCLL